MTRVDTPCYTIQTTDNNNNYNNTKPHTTPPHIYNAIYSVCNYPKQHATKTTIINPISPPPPPSLHKPNSIGISSLFPFVSVEKFVVQRVISNSFQDIIIIINDLIYYRIDAFHKGGRDKRLNYFHYLALP